MWNSVLPKCGECEIWKNERTPGKPGKIMEFQSGKVGTLTSLLNEFLKTFNIVTTKKANERNSLLCPEWSCLHTMQDDLPFGGIGVPKWNLFRWWRVPCYIWQGCQVLHHPIRGGWGGGKNKNALSDLNLRKIVVFGIVQIYAMVPGWFITGQLSSRLPVFFAFRHLRQK